MEYTEKQKDELLDGVALTVDFNSLSPEAQNDILKYLEHLKNKIK